MQDELSSTGEPSAIEVSVPLPLNHAWVAYACRAAGVAKPRWSPDARVWTTFSGAGDPADAVRISAGEAARTVRVRGDSRTARRIVTGLVTGMQWAVARKAGVVRSL